ncbi:MAG: rod shape-determining protein [Sporomusaceae bacterium]|jgi:cell division protein FtsA|nr:rod shape-determining protein [Sporomusaceae bacterium]
MDDNLLFALDIGTRSVVGLVGQRQADNVIRLLSAEREEHHTRAMLDGQIHDVREVAEILINIKKKLEQQVGQLTKVAVAAAGRALCTMRVSVEIDTTGRNVLTLEDERALELAAVQSAQRELAASQKIDDPLSYYCVGYSIISFSLDGTRLKSLVGQCGNISCIDAVATFLPRQVVDSLQSAVYAADLKLDTITLEPIAAINVLIPSTMRHLNLALVDIGAGTSDVAITKDGSVTAFGMVPFAGDEITEIISQKYLLDFNIAEAIKRQLDNKSKKISFENVLGITQKVAAKDFIDCISSKVAELAQAIAKEILTLNSEAPQAVLLVGGGSMTPLMTEFLAEALDVPLDRVAIRLPTSVKDITDIPDSLRGADAVTPLGILKISGSDSLNFLNITVNDRTLRMFNLAELTISDALLAAGFDVRTLPGRPGMGISISINGQPKVIPGSQGKPGKITCNGNDVVLSDPISDGDKILVVPGVNGENPAPVLRKTIPLPPPLPVVIDQKNYGIAPKITVNGKDADLDVILQDRDKVEIKNYLALKDVLEQIGIKVEPVKYLYKVNDAEQTFEVWPQYKVDGNVAELDHKIAAHSIIETAAEGPDVAAILGLTPEEAAEHFTVQVNNKPCKIPLRRHSVTVDKKPVSLSDKLPNNSTLEYTHSPNFLPILSEVLLASEFNPKNLLPGSKVTILLNGSPAEFTALVKDGDRVSIAVAIE